MAVFLCTWEFGLPLFCLGLLNISSEDQKLGKFQTISFTGLFARNVFSLQLMSLLGSILVCITMTLPLVELYIYEMCIACE